MSYPGSARSSLKCSTSPGLPSEAFCGLEASIQTSQAAAMEKALSWPFFLVSGLAGSRQLGGLSPPPLRPPALGIT